MAISKTTTVKYSHKKLTFVDGQLCNEDGEIIDLLDDLKAVFQNYEFDINVSLTKKQDLEVSNFKNTD